MFLNCGVRENSWESLGLQRDSTSPSKRKSVLKEIRTDAEAETPIIWPPYAKNWLIRKDPDARKDWRQEEKGTTEDEIVGWHHWFDGHEFEQDLGVSDRQGSLACCSPWGYKESDISEDWTELREREAWHAAVHGVAKSWIWLSHWTTTIEDLEKLPNSGTHLRFNRQFLKGFQLFLICDWFKNHCITNFKFLM